MSLPIERYIQCNLDGRSGNLLSRTSSSANSLTKTILKELTEQVYYLRKNSLENIKYLDKNHFFDFFERI